MAVLAKADVIKAFNNLDAEFLSLPVGINFHNDQLQQAFQAIEDWWEVNQASLAAAIDSATTPFVFSVAQKRKLAKVWALYKLGVL